MRILPAIIVCTLLGGAPAAKGPWSFRTKKDQFSGETTSFAETKTSNVLRFSFPYADPQRAVLTVRKKGDSTPEILFYLPHGQILQSFSQYGTYCSIEARFDDGPVQEFEGSGASSHSPNLVFITEEKEFLKALAGAKRLRLRMTIYQEGNVMFDFPVRGLPDSFIPKEPETKPGTAEDIKG